MKKNIFTFLLVVCFVFGVILVPVLAVESQWKLVVRVKGDVQSQKADESQWQYIWQSKMLKDGDKARTLKDSRAKITLSDQTVVTIGENTVVEVSKFQLTEKSRTAAFKLLSGKLRVQVGKFFTGKSDIKVETPSAVLAARGTDFFVEQQEVTKQGPGNMLTVIVFDGIVGVNTATQSLSVTAGNMLVIGATGGVIVSPVSLAPGVPVMTSAPGEAPGEAAGGGEAPAGGGEVPGGAPGGGTPVGDADLTMSSYGGAGTQGPTPGTSATFAPQPSTSGPTKGPVPQPPPIFNPSSSDTGSLPVVIQ